MKLGINVDHIATLRNARKGIEPDVIEGVRTAIEAGCDSIVCHLRIDRRHILDKDVYDIRKIISVPMNLEASLEDEIIDIALNVVPDIITIVPEKREELTTEGGLDIKKNIKRLEKVIPKLKNKKIVVSLFIDPEPESIKLSKELGADSVELHTGCYANSTGFETEKEFNRIKESAIFVRELGLFCAVGHGLNYENTQKIVTINEIEELNIGHSIISKSIFTGLDRAVKMMKNIINK
jgi:pyridoxine 5-phosphate synthase